MVTVYQGTETTYTAAVIIIRQLEDYIDNFSPRDFPLLSRVGLSSYPETVENPKVEYQLEEDVPLTDTLHVAVTDTTATQFTVHFAEYFNLNDVILIDSELLQVYSTDATNNYLTVGRGFAGSTAATHVIDSTIYRLGSARPEGSSPGWAQQVAVSQPYNYTIPLWVGCSA